MEGFKFKEPIKGAELEFAIIPSEKLVVPSIQRELSDNHIKRLMDSMEKVGFVEPLSVVPDGKGNYEVINGQHRLIAGRQLGMTEFPVVILPPEYKQYIIALNIEKVPSLKDKAHQAYEIFMEHLKATPDIPEYRLERYIESAYLITIGFITDRIGDKKFPGYAFEKVLKKADFFLDIPLEKAQEEREKRAQVLEKAKEVLNKRYEELQLQNPLLKSAIVSKAFQSVYGRYVRNLTDDFEVVFEKLIYAMKEV
ncbi:MAG: chromosome partitioning protein ParB, partial [Aquificota bacterium]